MEAERDGGTGEEGEGKGGGQLFRGVQKGGKEGGKEQEKEDEGVMKGRGKEVRRRAEVNDDRGRMDVNGERERNRGERKHISGVGGGVCGPRQRRGEEPYLPHCPPLP